MYIQQMGEIIPAPSQNTVGVCKPITYVILYYISSRLVTLLKVSDAPIQVSDIFLYYSEFQVHNFNTFIFSGQLWVNLLNWWLW